MPHRELLTESQRLSLNAPASDERGMVRHYTLSSEDLALINRRRGDPNRLGFALMLCYLESVKRSGVGASHARHDAARSGRHQGAHIYSYRPAPDRLTPDFLTLSIKQPGRGWSSAHT
jgi:hypothetical protein